MNIRILLAAAVLAVGAAAGSAKANLITNGDFSVSTDTGATVTGWNVSGDTSFYTPPNNIVNKLTNSASSQQIPGNEAQFATNGGSLTLSQDISTVAGQSYDLTFFFNSELSTSNDSFQALIDGQALFDTATAGLTNDLWVPEDVQFTATDDTTTIAFVGNNIDAFFDVADVNVPEPSTLALMLVGAAGVIGYGLRRRAAAPASFA